MSSNVGLSTPRGSGTSGYVQRNLSLLKPRDAGIGVPYSLDSASSAGRPPKQRKPDQEILTHKRLREIELAVCELEDELAEKGESEETIEEKTDALRVKLMAEMESNKKKKGVFVSSGRLKSYEVHERAELKERESEKLRKALGLRANEIGDGDDGEHPMARQEKRRRERELLEERKAEAEAQSQAQAHTEAHGDYHYQENEDHKESKERRR